MLINSKHFLKSKKNAVIVLAVSGLPVLLLPSLVLDLRYKFSLPDTAKTSYQIEYGRAIKSLTPPGSVVFSTEPNMEPVYYSERHIIRGILNDVILERALHMAEKEFNNTPFYLVLHNKNKNNFEKALQQHPLKASEGPYTAIRLEER